MGIFAEYITVINECVKRNDWDSSILKHFKEDLRNGSDADVEELGVILLTCVKCGVYSAMLFANIIVNSKKLINWKRHPDLVEDIFVCLTESKKYAKGASHKVYGDFMVNLVSMLRNNQIFNENVDKFFMLLNKAIATDENPLQRCTYHFTDDIPWERHTEAVLDFMDKAYDIFKTSTELRGNAGLAVCIYDTWRHFYRNFQNKQNQVVKYKDQVTKMFLLCKHYGWDVAGSDYQKGAHYIWLERCLSDFIRSYRDCKEIVQPIFKACVELWECEDEKLRENVDDLMVHMNGGKLAELDEEGDVTDKIIQRYLSGSETSLIDSLATMYHVCPDKINPHLDEIVKNLEVSEDWHISLIISFFRTVCVEHSEAMTANCVKRLIDTMKVENTAGIALMSLEPLSEKRPKLLLPHDDAIIDCMMTIAYMASMGGRILVQLAEESPEKGTKYLAALKKAIGNCESSALMIGLVYNMKTIGGIYPEELAKYKEFFEELKNDTVLKDHAAAALDVITGRSLAAVAKDVDDVQQDVAELDDRVTNTEENVTNLGKEVDSTKAEVVALSGEVNEQGQRLEELEDVVEETVEKVEEIDKKTLSHAPIWSRDVSKLLNPKSEHDWRLLASRLGYSNDDIRNWATQPNPCLSMFDEWFATNKTREATHAILKHIEEMDRMDAFVIVENALKQTEEVVEDEEVEYATPPPVFISYQWGLQEEVKLLKNHLEMAGFEGWIDIGQMGGGDKLFEKIDTGIRGAKVIICCVSEKYAKSPNCNREVNLSVNLGKPIIPLLMEKMSWPPKGSMGPIFGEYLFIRFFSRGGEESGDDRYWPPPKMQELLMQIRYSVVPNEELIKEPYVNWMSPPAEIIIIKPKDKKDSGKAVVNAGNTDTEEEESPEVFISYQWDKQPQIKTLYNRLSQLGYTCWLDILQMGGGDSLYDKIDKGVRGCKVVLTCVTSKYALSANCRREVSLADALKKPVIPLLLEKMTWPPEGPMSMVFTQLLYINFHSPDVSIQNSWDCPQLKELVANIQAHIPQIEDSLEPTEKEYSAEDTQKDETDPAMTVEVNNDKNNETNETAMVYDTSHQHVSTTAAEKDELAPVDKVNVKHEEEKKDETPVVDNTPHQQMEDKQEVDMKEQSNRADIQTHIPQIEDNLETTKMEDSVEPTQKDEPASADTDEVNLDKTKGTDERAMVHDTSQQNVSTVAIKDPSAPVDTVNLKHEEEPKDETPVVENTPHQQMEDKQEVDMKEQSSRADVTTPRNDEEPKRRATKSSTCCML